MHNIPVPLHLTAAHHVLAAGERKPLLLGGVEMSTGVICAAKVRIALDIGPIRLDTPIPAAFCNERDEGCHCELVLIKRPSVLPSSLINTFIFQAIIILCKNKPTYELSKCCKLFVKQFTL